MGVENASVPLSRYHSHVVLIGHVHYSESVLVVAEANLQTQKKTFEVAYYRHQQRPHSCIVKNTITLALKISSSIIRFSCCCGGGGDSGGISGVWGGGGGGGDTVLLFLFF